MDSLLLELGEFISQGGGWKCQGVSERKTPGWHWGLKAHSPVPHPQPQPYEGLAGLYPSCHLQRLVLISCCGSWGLEGRLQSRELKPVWDTTHGLWGWSE